MKRLDAIVIGAGHNGLVAAAYLARAGKSVLVVERSEAPGGVLRGPDLAPGFVAPGIVHTVGRFRASVIKDLKLDKRGLELIHPDVRLFAPQPDGSSVTFWDDATRTVEGIRSRSSHDAGSYAAFDARVRAVASFMAHVNAITPPDVKSPSLADLLSGLRLGRAFRKLGAKTGREAIRELPMAVADLAQEAFEDEAVRGALCTRGVIFTSCGPWAAGTAANFLNDSAGNDGGAAGSAVFAAGGTQALARVLEDAARGFGAEIRYGAEVTEIVAVEDRAVGVRVGGEQAITAKVVVSAADPKRTLRLLDPEVLGPTLVWRGENIRQPGSTGKIDLALSGVPAFNGATEEQLKGRIVVAPSIDHVERAADAHKYGRLADDPWLEATIPSLTDPSLAPEGKHVMSVLVQAAPRNLREGSWSSEGERLGDVAVKTLERYAPGLGELIEARRVTTPQDMEKDYGLTGGHVQHAEPGLDQFFAWRPMFGHSRYRFGIDGLYLAGSGAHPGGGVTGAPGANAAREILRDL